MSNKEKNSKIGQTLTETKVRRAAKTIKTFEVKVDASHLSKEKAEKLKRAFIQAKWIYNYCLGLENLFGLDYKRLEIPVNIFNKESGACDKVEVRKVNLGSQIRQSIYKQVEQNIIALSKSKKKGNKIGRLKF